MWRTGDAAGVTGRLALITPRQQAFSHTAMSLNYDAVVYPCVRPPPSPPRIHHVGVSIQMRAHILHILVLVV